MLPAPATKADGLMDAEALRARLGGEWAGAELRALGSVASTNDIAWAWAQAGCGEWTTVFAEEQVQGRGRFGRTWHCPRGRGVLMSVVLRPPGSGLAPPHVTALAALAVAEGIEAESGLRSEIRWPNDVVLVAQASRLCATGETPVPPRKVAGVLAECRGGQAAPCILGIGINVNARREEFPEALRATATSLAEEAGRGFAREAIAAAVLGRLRERYHDALHGRWQEVAEAWRQRASLLGEVVTVQSQGREFAGRLASLDPLRGITLELPGGELRAFRAEDTSLVLAL
ncbi:MAG: biotin--[acetyl-CoA-carboxylase] ligase [Planctomycetes bacterium]|nr:biotin--[acetyl-CoA-carboxylase] ligase [Planctomycetota bacterium]